MWKTLVRSMHFRGGWINLVRIRGLVRAVKCLRSQWSRVTGHALKTKDKLVHLVPSTTKKAAWCPVGLRFWKQRILYLGILWWYSEQGRGQVQAEVQAVMILEPYDPTDTMELKASVVSKGARWSFWSALAFWFAGTSPILLLLTWWLICSVSPLIVKRVLI